MDDCVETTDLLRCECGMKIADILNSSSPLPGQPICCPKCHTVIGIDDRVARCECGEKTTASENPPASIASCQCGRVFNYERVLRLYDEKLGPGVARAGQWWIL
jgi:hypothetical protein